MNRTGQSKLERGKNVDEGSGHGRQNWQQANKACRSGTAGKHSLLNKATAGRHSQRTLRPAQASQQTNGPQLAGLAAKTTAATNDVGLPLAVQLGGGEDAVVLAARKVGADLPNCPYPTYRLCLSLSLPTPLICNTQFSP